MRRLNRCGCAKTTRAPTRGWPRRSLATPEGRLRDVCSRCEAAGRDQQRRSSVLPRGVQAAATIMSEQHTVNIWHEDTTTTTGRGRHDPCVDLTCMIEYRGPAVRAKMGWSK